MSSNFVAKHSVTEFEVIEMGDDGGFPSFFIDHSGVINQFQTWLEDIAASESDGSPIRPCIILDPPKSGKTALLTRIAPTKIQETFTNPLVVNVNFLADVPTNTGEGFGWEYLKSFVRSLITILRKFSLVWNLGMWTHEDDPTDIGEYLIRVFEHLDSRGERIFFLWDEVQIWLRATDGPSLFDKITFQRQFRNLRFCVTGTMMMMYKAILSLPSDGHNSWSSAMHVVAADQSANPEALKNLTLKLLIERYPPLTSTYVDNYASDSSPAILCFLHATYMSHMNNIRVIDNIVQNMLKSVFRSDIPAVLALYTGDEYEKEVYEQLARLSLGLVRSDELDTVTVVLQSWFRIFRVWIEEDDHGFLFIKGCFGYLLAASLSVDGPLSYPSTPFDYPVPRYFTTILLLQKMLETQSQDKLIEMNNMSEKCLEGEHIDWTTYDPYKFFFLRSSRESNDSPVGNTSQTPYLEFPKCMSNTLRHLKGPQDFRRVDSHMRPIFYRWFHDLYNLLNPYEPRRSAYIWTSHAER